MSVIEERCVRCDEVCSEDEFVFNFGWCDRCFDASWKRYCDEELLAKARGPG